MSEGFHFVGSEMLVSTKSRSRALTEEKINERRDKSKFLSLKTGEKKHSGGGLAANKQAVIKHLVKEYTDNSDKLFCYDIYSMVAGVFDTVYQFILTNKQPDTPADILENLDNPFRYFNVYWLTDDMEDIATVEAVSAKMKSMYENWGDELINNFVTVMHGAFVQFFESQAEIKASISASKVKKAPLTLDQMKSDLGALAYPGVVHIVAKEIKANKMKGVAKERKHGKQRDLKRYLFIDNPGNGIFFRIQKAKKLGERARLTSPVERKISERSASEYIRPFSILPSLYFKDLNSARTYISTLGSEMQLLMEALEDPRMTDTRFKINPTDTLEVRIQKANGFLQELNRELEKYSMRAQTQLPNLQYQPTTVQQPAQRQFGTIPTGIVGERGKMFE